MCILSQRGPFSCVVNDSAIAGGHEVGAWLMQFSQRKADDQVRWALLNVVTILRRHAKTHRQLAEAMSSGKSVGQCILLIEESLSSTPAADI